MQPTSHYVGCCCGWRSHVLPTAAFMQLWFLPGRVLHMLLKAETMVMLSIIPCSSLLASFIFNHWAQCHVWGFAQQDQSQTALANLLFCAVSCTSLASVFLQSLDCSAMHEGLRSKISQRVHQLTCPSLLSACLASDFP